MMMLLKVMLIMMSRSNMMCQWVNTVGGRHQVVRYGGGSMLAGDYHSAALMCSIYYYLVLSYWANCYYTANFI